MYVQLEKDESAQAHYVRKPTGYGPSSRFQVGACGTIPSHQTTSIISQSRPQTRTHGGLGLQMTNDADIGGITLGRKKKTERKFSSFIMSKKESKKANTRPIHHSMTDIT
jgi:hypothetical protein